MAGVPLTRISKTEYASCYDRQTGRWAESGTGVAFSYGGVERAGSPTKAPYIEVGEAAKRYPGFQRGVVNYVPPEGSLLLIGSHIGAMRKDGLQVSIEGSSEEVILAVARALEPMPPNAESGARR